MTAKAQSDRSWTSPYRRMGESSATAMRDGADRLEAQREESTGGDGGPPGGLDESGGARRPRRTRSASPARPLEGEPTGSLARQPRLVVTHGERSQPPLLRIGRRPRHARSGVLGDIGE